MDYRGGIMLQFFIAVMNATIIYFKVKQGQWDIAFQVICLFVNMGVITLIVREYEKQRRRDEE